MDQKDTKEKKNIKKAVRKIQKYEKLFSARKYKGKGKKYIEIMHGKQPVSIIASQAVVCTAEEGEERPAGRLWRGKRCRWVTGPKGNDSKVLQETP